MLDDARDPVVLAAHDPAVAGGVVEHGGEDRAGGAAGAVAGDEGARSWSAAAAACRRGGRGRRRLVVVAVVVGEGGEGDRDGVAGAPLDVLLDELEREVGGACSDSFLVTRSAPWPTTTTARSSGEPAEAVEDVEHHRPAAQQVQRLRAGRAHAGALAGGEDDGGERGVGVGSVVMLGGEGSNLQLVGSKGRRSAS